MNRSSQAGFVAAGALLLAAVTSLAFLAGCHAPTVPAALARANAVEPEAAPAAVVADDPARVRPYEELFYVIPPEDATPQN